MPELAKMNPNNYPLKIYFKNGLVFSSSTSMGVYETNNCLDEDDPNYLEYYVCAVKISKIFHSPVVGCDDAAEEVKCGSMIELSEFNEPTRVEQNDGRVI